MRQRLVWIYLQSDTLYAEWCMAILSVVMGIWWLLPWAMTIFSPRQVAMHIPHIVAAGLIVCGCLKGAGVLANSLTFRKWALTASVFTWLFYAVAILMPGGPSIFGGVVIGFTCAFINACILIKLRVINHE